MDEREDYADHDLRPLEAELRRWYEVARNLLVVIGLVGLALILMGLVLVKVVAVRDIHLPKVPPPDPAETTTKPAT